tara:strand:+ start:86 stop:379 length:294 start_codon:yes stop_codon:yes gene_type:complete
MTDDTDNTLYTEDDNIIVSETPFYTLDWYIKWIASVFVLASMSIRGVEGYVMVDLSLSLVGVFLWTIVSFMWNDRALILLNVVGFLFLLKTFITTVV